MPRDPDESRLIRALRDDSTVWAVVGLSNNVTRPAFEIASFLQSVGKRVVPIHPSASTVLGERGYPSLADAVAEVGTIDVVDCFVNSAAVGTVVDEAISLGIKAVWMQLGVRDDAAAQRARDAGVDVVMNRCPSIEWSYLD